MRAPNQKYIIQISSVLVFLFVARNLSCIHHRPVWLRYCSGSYCNKRLFKFHELNECRTIIKKKNYLDIGLKEQTSYQNGRQKAVCHFKTKKQLIQMKIARQWNQMVNRLLIHKNKLKLSTFQSNQLAAYRYGCLRQQIADFQLKIKQVKQTIRSRNPYLLTFIDKL